MVEIIKFMLVSARFAIICGLLVFIGATFLFGILNVSLLYFCGDSFQLKHFVYHAVGGCIHFSPWAVGLVGSFFISILAFTSMMNILIKSDRS